MAKVQIVCVVAAFVSVVSAEHSGGHYGGRHAKSSIYIEGPVIGPAQPIHGVVKDKHGHEEHFADYDAYPHSKYEYKVADHHTGDFHSQQESRNGHKVVGEYKQKEKSGNVRTVKYVADKDGFRAEVHNSHHNIHPQGYSSQGGHGYGSTSYSQGDHGYSGQGGHGYSSQGGHGYASTSYSQGDHGYSGQGGHGYSSQGGHGYASTSYSQGDHGYSGQGGHGYSSQGGHGYASTSYSQGDHGYSGQGGHGYSSQGGHGYSSLGGSGSSGGLGDYDSRY